MSRLSLTSLLFLLLVAALAYRVPVRRATLLFDDHVLLEQDARILLPEHRGALWTTPVYSAAHVPETSAEPVQAVHYYRPLALWTLAVPAGEAWIRAPFLHLENVLLHLLIAVLILAWAGGRGSWSAGMLGALVFLTHPIGAEAVSWITGRMDVLAVALAAIAALLVHRKGESRGALAIAAVFLLGAFLSKETALMLAPLVVLASSGRKGECAVAVGVALGIYAAMRHAALGAGVPPASGEGAGPLQALGTLLVYLRHLLLPCDLQLIHYAPAEATPVADLGTALTLVLSLAAGAGAVRRLREGDGAPAWLLGVVLLSLLPVLGILPMPFPLSDRYLYAAAAAYGAGVSALLARLEQGRVRTVVIAVVILVCAGQVRELARRNAFWVSETTLLRAIRGQRYMPARARLHLVEVLLGQRKHEEAAAEARLSLERYPDDPGLRLLLGRALLGARKLPEALAEFRKIPASSTKGNLARLNQVHVLRFMGEETEARALLDTLLVEIPGLAEARGMRGQWLLEKGDVAGALRDLEAAVADAPKNATVRFNLAVALVQAGRAAEAIPQLEKLAHRYPHQTRYAGALAQVLHGLGRMAEAKRWLAVVEEHTGHGH